MEITQDILNKLFIYDKNTGSLTRKISRAKHKKGEEVGSYHDGYKRTKLFKKNILVHRLIWIMQYGYNPKNQIDHINHVRDDNRLCNLREVTNTINQQNTCISTRNSSGALGVHFRKDKKRWVARITINKKRKQLGTFQNFEDAVKCRKRYEKEYGFHENHGKHYKGELSTFTPDTAPKPDKAKQ